MSQSSKAKIIQILQTKLWCHFFQTLNSYYVDRILYSLTDSCSSVVTLGCIIYRRTIRIVVWLILKSSGKSHSFFIKSRCIGRQDLKCRTRLSGGICGSIKGQTGCFFSTSANDGLYITGMLINHTHGRLWLRCKTYSFCYYGAAIRKNMLFVTVNIGLSLFLGIKEKIKFRIFILEIQLQHFFAVVHFFTFRVLYCQGIIKSILHIIRIIGRICILFIQNRLNLCVLRGINTQTTTVYQILRLCSCITFDLHKVIDHLVNQFILKITVNSILCTGIDCLSCLYT